MNNLEIEKTSNINLCEELDKMLFESSYNLDMFSSDNLKSLYLLKEYGVVVGYAYLHGDEVETEIYRIGILKLYRNKGYGTYFLNALLDLHHSKRYILEVSSKNISAINLYKKCNFKEYYIRKDYYSDGVDAILMENNKEW